MAWQISEDKFLSPHQVKKLRIYLSQRAKLEKTRAQTRWMALDLLLSTGLRCFEACDLLIEDCHIGYDQSSIFVRNGKGGKSASIIIDQKLKKHLKDYIKWRGASSGPLLVSERGQPFTRSGLQKLIKRVFSELGFASYLSIHSCRHTFCSSLYRNTKDLRLVQQQARHSSPVVTTVYANLLSQEIQRGMEGLYE